MSRPNKALILGCIIGAAVAALWLYSASTPKGTVSSDMIAAADVCNNSSESVTLKLDCWMGLIEEVFDEDGTEAAFNLFQHLYLTYEYFSDSGCHKHAHRIGDLAFYHDYLKHYDLSQVEFPTNASACGYGFYHGFFEHLVQNNPTSEYVDQTCPFMKDTISDTAPAVSQICYHGSGHGFLLAQADTFYDPKEWTIENFTRIPLEQCSELKKASEHEKRECYFGVFTVLTEWMVEEEYGLSYDFEKPFWHCDRLENKIQVGACYTEVSQKLDKEYTFIDQVVQTGEYIDFYTIAVSVALAGKIQHNPDGLTVAELRACQEALIKYGDVCLRSFAAGLAEHGPPNMEYIYLERFCSDSALSGEERERCIVVYAEKLQRFFNAEEISELCSTDAIMPETCQLAGA